MKAWKVLRGIALATALAGCGKNGSATPDAGSLGFQQPPDTVAVNFTVNDKANKVYGPGDLVWKSAMQYDSITRKITPDSSWAGPWATLYDDGPWTAGGHERIGSQAGDHEWGVTVFATPPASDSQVYEYGLVDASYNMKFGGDTGWAWLGSNGSFVVMAGTTALIPAAGQVFRKFGLTDVQITLDTTMLAPRPGGGVWDTSKVYLKSSAWSWGSPEVTKDGTGKAVFTLSQFIGPGKPLNHSGGVATGDRVEFVWVLNTDNYAASDGKVFAMGVTAGSKMMNAASFTDLTIGYTGNNTSVSIP